MSRPLLWAALATGVALPRWLYLAAQWSDAPSLRTLAWAGDVVCLVVAAFALWRLQRALGDEASRASVFIATAGFALDAVTTSLAPWAAAPWIIVVVAVVAWTYGTSRWLAALCAAVGTSYFVFRLATVCIVVSAVLELWFPKGPALPLALVLDTGIAVQCALLARGVREDETSAP